MFYSTHFRFVCRAIMWLVALTLSVISQAQSFDELELRLQEHPSLLSLNYDALAERQQSIASSALPDPVITVGVNNVPFSSLQFDRFLPSNKSVGIEQQFPNRAKRQAASNKALAMANRTDSMALAHYYLLRAELIGLLHERKRISDQRQLINRQNDLYDELLDVAESEIDAGRPVVFRLAEIEGERTEVAKTLAELDGEVLTINAHLIELLGMVPDTPPPSVTLMQWSGAPTEFNSVITANKQLAIADQEIEQAKAEWKTQWGAQLTYQQRKSGRDAVGSGFAGDDWFSASINFSVPAWSSKRQAPNLRAAEARRAAAYANYQAIARTATATYRRYDAIRKTAIENERVLTQELAAIELEIESQLSRYESGDGDYTPVVDGELTLLKIRAQIIEHSKRAVVATVRMNALLEKS